MPEVRGREKKKKSNPKGLYAVKAGVWIFMLLLTLGLILSGYCMYFRIYILVSTWECEVRFGLQSFILTTFSFFKKSSLGKVKQSSFTPKAIHRK